MKTNGKYTAGDKERRGRDRDRGKGEGGRREKAELTSVVIIATVSYAT